MIPNLLQIDITYTDADADTLTAEGVDLTGTKYVFKNVNGIFGACFSVPEANVFSVSWMPIEEDEEDENEKEGGD